MAKQVFVADTLTGGTAGCLDDIDHSILEDGNVAIVIASSVYFYVYSDSEAGAESSPSIIIPDSNVSGTGAWTQVTPAS